VGFFSEYSIVGSAKKKLKVEQPTDFNTIIDECPVTQWVVQNTTEINLSN